MCITLALLLLTIRSDEITQIFYVCSKLLCEVARSLPCHLVEAAARIQENVVACPIPFLHSVHNESGIKN